jgi:hypothetical protein
MGRTYGQSGQDRHEAALPRLGLPEESTNEQIFDGIDQNFNSPIRLYANSPADAVLNLGAQEVEQSNGVGKSIPPIDSNIPTFPQSTINFQTGATTGGTFSLAFPASTVGQFRRLGLTLLSSGTVQGVFSPEAASVGALSNPGLYFIDGGIPLGWLDLECTDAAGKFKTAGSATAIIENKVGSDIRVHVFGAGAGGSSSEEGGQGADLATISYYVQMEDSLLDDELIDSSNSTGTIDIVNEQYGLQYDASKTLTVSTNNVTIGSACSFTVQVGDIVKTIGNDKHTRVATVNSQTDFDVEDGSVLTTGQAGLFSQVYQSKEHIALESIDAQIPDYASEKFEEALVTYEDSAVEQLGTDADVAYSVCTNATFNTPTNWINDTVRPDGLFEEVSPVAIPNAVAGNKMRVRFFANKASGTGTVYLEEFNVYYLPRSKNAGYVVAAMIAKYDYSGTSWSVKGSGATPTVTVVSTKTRIYLGFPVDRYRSEDLPASQLEVLIDGVEVPQYVSGLTTGDFYYQFIDSSTIEFNKDLTSGASDDFFVVCKIADAGSVDVANISERIGTIEGYFNIGLHHYPLTQIAKDFVSMGGETTDLSLSTGSLLIQDVWASSGNLNTARRHLAGSGTQNAALSFGGTTGSYSATTEKFNGSTWSSTGNLNTARYGLAGSGTQNAALSFGGITSSYSAVTEKFNGTSWSSTGNLNTARSYLAGSGTQNAALSFGGTTGSSSAVTEKFNGSTWSSTGNLNTARRSLAGSGTQNAALSFGGDTGASSESAVTEKFNGSTWTASGNLNTARYRLAGSGTQNAALNFGGYVGSYSAVTEKRIATQVPSVYIFGAKLVSTKSLVEAA